MQHQDIRRPTCPKPPVPSISPKASSWKSISRLGIHDDTDEATDETDDAESVRLQTR
jgi:hypothetical protein